MLSLHNQEGKRTGRYATSLVLELDLRKGLLFYGLVCQSSFLWTTLGLEKVELSSSYCQGSNAVLFIGSSALFPILSLLPSTVGNGSLSTRGPPNPLPGPWVDRSAPGACIGFECEKGVKTLCCSSGNGEQTRGFSRCEVLQRHPSASCQCWGCSQQWPRLVSSGCCDFLLLSPGSESQSQTWLAFTSIPRPLPTGLPCTKFSSAENT